MPELSLILPVVNEEDIIETVIAEIIKTFNKMKVDYEIVLVENESEDNSWQVINQLTKQNKRIQAVKTKRGYGSAIIYGISKSKGKYICYMPSDGQIDVNILPKLWQLTKTEQFDVVKIKRIGRESTVRLIRSKIFNLLARLLFRIKIADINGSPRIVLKKNIEKLQLQSTDSFIDTEFAVKAKKLNFKFKEIPMRNLIRIGGKSTVQVATVIEFLRNFYYFRFVDNLCKWQSE